MKRIDSLEFPVIIKILKEEYANDLLDGNLYMNNLKYFVDLESDFGKKGVGDIREASLLNIKKHKLFIEIDGQERKEVKIGPAPGIIYDESSLNHPVFCAIGKIVHLENSGNGKYIGQLILQKENLVDFISNEEGEYKAIVIVDCTDFLDKIKNCGVAFKSGLIKYRDMRVPIISGRGLILDDTFTKDKEFENQSEFRIELLMHSKEPYVLEIGDMRSIAFKIDCKTLLTGITIIQYIESDFGES